MAEINSVNFQQVQVAARGPQANDEEFELREDAKTLASKIGVAYSKTDDTESILANIADELEAQIDEAENNPQELSKLMGYFSQLKNLDSMFDEIHAVKDTISSAMQLVTRPKQQEYRFE